MRIQSFIGGALNAILKPFGLVLNRLSTYQTIVTQLEGYRTRHGALATKAAQSTAPNGSAPPIPEGPSVEDDYNRLDSPKLYDDYKEYGEIFVRRWTNFAIFPKFADRVAARVNKKIAYNPRSKRGDEAKVIAETLRREGLYRLGSFLTPMQVDEVVDYYRRIPCLPGHVPNASPNRTLRYVGDGADQYFSGCYRISEIANAPHLLNTALNPFLLDISAHYLGCIPTLTWLQTWWSFPNPKITNVGSAATRFHRDQNDYRMFWIYMYLTDTTLDNGAHFIIRRSDDAKALSEELAYAEEHHPHLREIIAEWPAEKMLQTNGYNIPDNIKEEGLKRLIEPIMGTKGEIFLSTGINFHKILPATKGRRLLFAARYQLHGGPEIGMLDDMEQVPGWMVPQEIKADDQLKYMTRCIIKW